MTTSIDPRIELNHNDLNVHATIDVKLYGNETSWIGDVSGNTTDSAVVSLRCKQLTLMGDLASLEAVINDWVALLAEVRNRHDFWEQLLPRARRSHPASRIGIPHPFARRADGRTLPA